MLATQIFRMAGCKMKSGLRVFVWSAAFAGVAGLYGCQHKAHVSPKNSVSAFTIGTIALQVGSDQSAGKTGYDEKYLTLASKELPDEPAVWANLGLLYLRRGDFTRAGSYLDKAEKLDADSAAVEGLIGLLDDQKGDVQGAIAHYKRSLELQPGNLQASYALSQQYSRLNTPEGLRQEEQLLQQILGVQPGNLFAMIKLAHVAAVRNDAAVLSSTMAGLQARASTFTSDAVAELKQVLRDQREKNLTAAAIDTTYLQNLLKRNSDYGQGSLALQGDIVHGLAGAPIERFLSTPNPPPNPSPLDAGLSYEAGTPASALVSQWAGSMWLNSSGKVELLYARAGRLYAGDNSFNVAIPGAAKAGNLAPASVLPIDLNYDLKTDLVIADKLGISFYLQGTASHFVNVDSKTHLPNAVLHQAYAGIWQADLNADGEIDIVAAPVNGAPFEIQNNGDGTYSVQRPFPGITNVRGFSWVDLDNSGNPAACFLDSTGRLHVFANLRGGIFKQVTAPAIPGVIVAIANGAINPDGQLQILALMKDGTLVAAGLASNDVTSPRWTVTPMGAGHVPATSDVPGSCVLLTGDLDNNGGMDVVAGGPGWWQPWLCGPHYHLHPRNFMPGTAGALMDFNGDGLLDVEGLNSSNQPVAWLAHSNFHYSWQELRPTPAEEEFKRSDYFAPDNSPLSGNRRINSYGIGGEMEARAGLLYEKQMMQGAVVHFGMGTYPRLDAVRIVWPNGDTRALFGDQLTPDMSVKSLHFLKGSCPYLFVWNGKKFVFVTDCIWRSPLGLRIDAQATAGVGQTRDWVKIPGDMMVARNGFYEMRVTAELWETHFFDYLGLLAVDHPKGTGMWVDERFAIPPPPLKAYITGPLMPLAGATDDRGNDVSSLLAHRDGKYVNSFGLGAYQGVTRTHWVQLNLGNAPVNKPLWLVCQGWIHPTDSSINVAIGNTHNVKPQSLSLWVPDAKGHWSEVKKDLGFPEGKVKTVLIDVTHVFKPGAPHILRLQTNLEVYWDAIHWAVGLPNAPSNTISDPLAAAHLRYRGYSVLRSADPYSPELPVGYRQILTRSPRWRDLVGYYTKYGNVTALLKQVDDRYVIMNAGDELRLRYPLLPPPRAGWVRDFVLVGDGWVKDGDYNTEFSKTVLPLPSHTNTAYNVPPTGLTNDPVWKKHRSDWLTYQTRWVSPAGFMRGLRP